MNWASFNPPEDLDPVRAIQEHFAEGWKYEVEVLIGAPVATVEQWIPRNLGRLEAVDADHTRLVGSTDEPDWYAYRIASIEAPFQILRPRELREAVHTLGLRLLQAGTSPVEADS